MSDSFEIDTSALQEGLEQDLVRELERQTSEEIQKVRQHERVDVKIRVVARPGDSSRQDEPEASGLTGDISQGGFRAMFSVPLGVGDVYRIEFDQDQLDVPLVFARCLRCRLVREDAFESGFRFFSPIQLPGSEKEGGLLG